MHITVVKGQPQHLHEWRANESSALFQVTRGILALAYCTVTMPWRLTAVHKCPEPTHAMEDFLASGKAWCNTPLPWELAPWLPAQDNTTPSTRALFAMQLDMPLCTQRCSANMPAVCLTTADLTLVHVPLDTTMLSCTPAGALPTMLALTLDTSASCRVSLQGPAAAMKSVSLGFSTVSCTG